MWSCASFSRLSLIWKPLAQTRLGNLLSRLTSPMKSLDKGYSARVSMSRPRTKTNHLKLLWPLYIWMACLLRSIKNCVVWLWPSKELAGDTWAQRCKLSQWPWIKSFISIFISVLYNLFQKIISGWQSILIQSILQSHKLQLFVYGLWWGNSISIWFYLYLASIAIIFQTIDSFLVPCCILIE